MEPTIDSVASDDEGVDIADLRAKVGSGADKARFLCAAQLPEPHRAHHDRGPAHRPW